MIKPEFVVFERPSGTILIHKQLVLTAYPEPDPVDGETPWTVIRLMTGEEQHVPQSLTEVCEKLNE